MNCQIDGVKRAMSKAFLTHACRWSFSV